MRTVAEIDREKGQASVELVALLPLLAALAALGWQAALAGQAWWLTRIAADSAARAQALGEQPRAAAVRSLPPRLRAGLRVDELERGAAIRVRVRLPAVLGVGFGSTTAVASMESQR